MKEKNKIFFGVKGITSTSANNIANIAKEVMEESRALLENITFVNCNVGLISSDVSRLTEKGYDTDELRNIVSSINRVAECNALIAYLREAIKAKEEELSYIEGITTTKFLKIKGIEVADPRNLYNLDLMTEEDAIALLSPQERIDYLILEATAAAIGNRIHPGKSFSEARRKLELKRKEPIKLVGSGSDALVYAYSPSADVDEVNDTFMELQSAHRTANKQLNALKFKIKQIMDDHNLKARREFATQSEEFDRTIATYAKQAEAFIEEQKKELLELKIVIPSDFQKLFDELNSLIK